MYNDSTQLDEFLRKTATLKSRLSDADFAQLADRYPEEYLILSDVDDIIRNFDAVKEVESDRKNSLRYESDVENIIIVRNDFKLIRQALSRLFTETMADHRLYRIYKDRSAKSVILVEYSGLDQSTRRTEPGLKPPSWGEMPLLKNNEDLKKRTSFEVISARPTKVRIELVNSSFLTLMDNLMEIMFSKGYGFIEIWRNADTLGTSLPPHFKKKIKSMYRIEIAFFDRLSPEDIDSFWHDCQRYLQPFLNKRSLFDIVGPSMVGPSSSHTAGANRIGQIGRKFLSALLNHHIVGEIRAVRVKLIGSFRDTGVGHNTPEAIVGGLVGRDTDHPDMIAEGTKTIEERKIPLRPDVAMIDFLGFLRGSDDDDRFYKDENESNIAEIIADTDKGVYSITGFSLGGGNVQVRFINRQKIDPFIDGKSKLYLSFGEKVTLSDLSHGGAPIDPIIREGALSTKNFVYEHPFDTFEELIGSLGTDCRGDNLIAEILKWERSVSGLSSAESRAKMTDFWGIMDRSVSGGLDNAGLSKMGLTGNNSLLLGKAYKDGMGMISRADNIYTRSLRYAIAVNEINAKNGVIVACPTGGSCGILPGILRAWKELTLEAPAGERPSGSEVDEQILGAMFVAGFLGMILFDDVPTAGAKLGCQAEIGGGAAMAAGALAFLEGGDLGTIVQAFTLALKNSMGLVCDPVAGLVEIPCVKRNGIYTSMAISSSVMAMAGIQSAISPDEVVLAVKEVGERLHEDYKETARGGLAKTRDGKKIEALMQEASDRLFNSTR